MLMSYNSKPTLQLKTNDKNMVISKIQEIKMLHGAIRSNLSGAMELATKVLQSYTKKNIVLLACSKPIMPFKPDTTGLHITLLLPHPIKELNCLLSNYVPSPPTHSIGLMDMTNHNQSISPNLMKHNSPIENLNSSPSMKQDVGPTGMTGFRSNSQPNNISMMNRNPMSGNLGTATMSNLSSNTFQNNVQMNQFNQTNLLSDLQNIQGNTLSNLQAMNVAQMNGMGMNLFSPQMLQVNSNSQMQNQLNANQFLQQQINNLAQQQNLQGFTNIPQQMLQNNQYLDMHHQQTYTY
jgi:hypothetical protein